MLIDSPTTYEEAIKVYKQLKIATERSTKVVEYDLQPLSNKCGASIAIVNQITDENVRIVSNFVCHTANILTVKSTGFICVPFPTVVWLSF